MSQQLQGDRGEEEEERERQTEREQELRWEGWAFSAGVRGHWRSRSFVGTKKARGNDNTHPFAIVLGKERRMEE